jgi:hypothetical protein
VVIFRHTGNEKSAGAELRSQFAWQQIKRECTCFLVRTNPNNSRGTENDGEDSSEGEEGSGKAGARKAGTGEEARGEEGRGKEAGREEGECIGGVKPPARPSAGLTSREVRVCAAGPTWPHQDRGRRQRPRFCFVGALRAHKWLGREAWQQVHKMHVSSDLLQILSGRICEFHRNLRWSRRRPSFGSARPYAWVNEWKPA